MNDIVGTFNAPAGVMTDPANTGSLLGKIILFIIVIAGIFALWQFVSGGLDYITSSGDKTKISNALQKINMSIVGLIIIAASFIIVAIIGQLFFGKWDIFVSPTLQTIN